MNKNTYNIAIIGAGKIGETICDLLLTSGDYHVTLTDSNAALLERIPDHPMLSRCHLDINDADGLRTLLQAQFAVLSATPFYLTHLIAEAAHDTGTHYLDLTEDVASTERVLELAATARSAMIPQCGLAPGFISIVTMDIAREFDALETIRMCVGALPQYPSNALNYNLTWSTDGVINEYCEPCVCIEKGQKVLSPALENLQHFSLDGINYETFNTSGGIGTLTDTLAGKVSNLSYQTIRYPGHRDVMKILLQDLRLSERRDLLKDVLENSVPATMQDVVLIFVTVSGRQEGRLIQKTYANKIYGMEINGVPRSAIQITTASSICATLDLLVAGQLPDQGLVRQEDIPLQIFLQNRFGSAYQIHHPQALGGASA
ncbi:MAG: saccharopine dehydrogenase NADP-binding domain-containing protein [Pseudomonadales bacterium]|nr:saccharopine dehydrogenase NADP-binding domain-containing protein [Pseudomonadales bacterium]